ncbi:hypothetical protein NDU88_001112 [Pleurodeles waltl]|uniref:Uncharacterized protein n=1 Tax=Pleurodeles waltl TaxID=8319 RepID=A0AAV7KRS1_PLEWA|nr:hypothetical protein NDU88_001112 [Pleurodeles waltl]
MDEGRAWTVVPQVKTPEKTKGQLWNNPGERHRGEACLGQGSAPERGEADSGGQRGGTVQQNRCKRKRAGARSDGLDGGWPVALAIALKTQAGLESTGLVMGKTRSKEGDSHTDTPGMTHHTRATVAQKESMVPTIQAQFDQILATTADTKTALQLEIGVVSEGLWLLRAEQRKLVEKMTEMEKEGEAMQPIQQDLKK